MLDAALRVARLLPICMACMVTSVHADEAEDRSSDVLATPPLTLGTSLFCVAANIGKQPATLDISMHDVNGTVVAHERCTLPPGAVNAGGVQCGIVQSAPAGFVGYCTFDVIQGRKKDIRAAILSQNVNEGPGNAPTALPAQ